MKEKRHIEYPKLKQATQAVLAFAQLYASGKIDLRTSLEDEMGLYELDEMAFLEDFEKTFGIPHLSQELVTPPKQTPLGHLRDGLRVLPVLVLFPLLLIIAPFSRYIFKETVKQKIRKNAQRVTLGDLAATVALGHYVKREEVQICIR